MPLVRVPHVISLSILPPLAASRGRPAPRPRHRAEAWRGGRQAASSSSSSAPTRRSAGGVQGPRPLAARRSRRAAAVACTRGHRAARTRGRHDVVAERREAGRAETERQRRPRAQTWRWRQGGAARGRRCRQRRRALLPPPSPDPGAGEPSSLSPSRRQSPASSAVSPSPGFSGAARGLLPPPLPATAPRLRPVPTTTAPAVARVSALSTRLAARRAEPATALPSVPTQLHPPALARRA